MLTLPSNIPVFVLSKPIDMRKSFDGLAALVIQSMKQDSHATAFYVFFNRTKDKVKILYWDRNGYGLWYKRLEEGRYRLPEHQSMSYQLSVSDLSCLLEGIDLLQKRRFKTL